MPRLAWIGVQAPLDGSLEPRIVKLVRIAIGKGEEKVKPGEIGSQLRERRFGQGEVSLPRSDLET